MIKTFERIVEDDKTLFFLPGCHVYDVDHHDWKKMAGGESSDEDYYSMQSPSMEKIISITKEAVESVRDEGFTAITVVRCKPAYDTPSKIMIVAGPDTTPGAEPVHWFD